MTSGLLGLLGIDADPLKSREHILIANILDKVWSAGQALDVAALIGAIQKPPLTRWGCSTSETFFPAKDRTGLAMSVNNLLAAPGFSAWMEGEPLDVQRLLFTAEGKPRISILSIAHLSDAERMFFVTLLLNEVIAWMRNQTGTSSLRALLYMDEIFGYFPPTANAAFEAAHAHAAQAGARIWTWGRALDAESGRPRLQGIVECGYLVDRAAADRARQAAGDRGTRERAGWRGS